MYGELRIADPIHGAYTTGAIAVCSAGARNDVEASTRHRGFGARRLQRDPSGRSLAWADSTGGRVSVALILPFGCTQRQQSAAHGGSKRRSKIADRTRNESGSGHVQHKAAKPG
jgi:hypothetical protein